MHFTPPPPPFIHTNTSSPLPTANNHTQCDEIEVSVDEESVAMKVSDPQQSMAEVSMHLPPPLSAVFKEKKKCNCIFL
jgi:hypothetical protein